MEQIIAEIEHLRDGSRADYAKARELAEANRHKYPQIEALYQTFLLHTQDGDEAVKILQPFLHLPFVQARLGYHLTLNGCIAEGLELLQQAASAGHQFAKHALAIMLYNGKGMPKDVSHAVVMLEALAAENFLPSMYSLGVHHYKPPFEAKGDETGLNLIRKAAEAGYETAIRVLRDLEKRAIMFGVAATSY